MFNFFYSIILKSLLKENSAYYVFTNYLKYAVTKTLFVYILHSVYV